MRSLLAFILLTLTAYGADPLPTAGQMGESLGTVPFTTPLRLSDGKIAGLEMRNGTLTLVPAETPGPTLPEPRPPFGNFALQPGGQSKDDPSPPRGERLITEIELRLADVEGMTIRLRPHWISVNGKWDFSFVDASVQRCRNTGDIYTLLLIAGNKDPLSEANLSFYEKAAIELGKRYGNDPLCVGPHVTGSSPPGHSEELFWGNPMPPAAERATERMIRAWSDAFPRHYKLMAGSGNDPAAMRRLQKYGINYTKGKFLYKNNAASAKMPLTWVGNTLLVDNVKAGGVMGWEALDDSATTRFGGTLQQAFDKQDTLTRQAGVSHRQTYRAWYPGDLPRLKNIK